MAMNIEQLANKIENYNYYSKGRNIILELEKNDNDWSVILKKSNGMCIIGLADCGDHGDFSFNNPETYSTVFEALKSKAGDTEEVLFELELIGEEEDVNYIFEPSECIPDHTVIHTKIKMT